MEDRLETIGRTELAGWVYEQLQAYVNPERKEKARSYFPTAMEVMGVAVPDLRTLRKRLSSKFRDLEGAEILEIAHFLIRKNVMEIRQIAYELVEFHREAFSLLDRPELESLGRGMDNWATVDAFSVGLTGRAWQQRQIDDDDIADWSASSNRWWRRCALVSTVPLNLKSRGGRGEPEKTLSVCERLVDDHDDMVVKAESWALRELSKRYPTMVMNFIKQYKDHLHPRVIREVRRKIEKGTKNG